MTDDNSVERKAAMTLDTYVKKLKSAMSSMPPKSTVTLEMDLLPDEAIAVIQFVSNLRGESLIEKGDGLTQRTDSAPSSTDEPTTDAGVG